MKFFNVQSVEQVKHKLNTYAEGFNIGIEHVSILNATDRILAEDIVAPINVPEFNRSTVDGYAIACQDSMGACETIPTFLTIKDEIKMGEMAKTLVSIGTAVYVPTGGMIPEGADSVVMIEHTEKLEDLTLAIYKAITVRENIIQIGDDVKKGQIVLKKGRKIQPKDIGILACLGFSMLSVFKKPKVSIISTGNEIIDICEKQEIGKIRDINGYALYALIDKLGGQVIRRTIIKDEYELLKHEVQLATDSSDLVLLSGGSSVGTHDYTYDVLNELEGEGVFVHGVSIKPGKPTIIGEGNGKIIFGLPGHPFSSIIIYKVFVEYYLKKIMQLSLEEQNNMDKWAFDAVMTTNIHSASGKETYQMVTIEELNGIKYVAPKFGKSGMITMISEAAGYIIIPTEKEGLNKGDIVRVFPI